MIIASSNSTNTDWDQSQWRLVYSIDNMWYSRSMVLSRSVNRLKPRLTGWYFRSAKIFEAYRDTILITHRLKRIKNSFSQLRMKTKFHQLTQAKIEKDGNDPGCCPWDFNAEKWEQYVTIDEAICNIVSLLRETGSTSRG